MDSAIRRALFGPVMDGACDDLLIRWDASTVDVEIVEPVVDRGVVEPGDHDRMAHIVRKADEMRGYVEGQEVTALCGKSWVPSRDPERYPVCQTCVEVLGRIRGV